MATRLPTLALLLALSNASNFLEPGALISDGPVHATLEKDPSHKGEVYFSKAMVQSASHQHAISAEDLSREGEVHFSKAMVQRASRQHAISAEDLGNIEIYFSKAMVQNASHQHAISTEDLGNESVYFSKSMVQSDSRHPNAKLVVPARLQVDSSPDAESRPAANEAGFTGMTITLQTKSNLGTTVCMCAMAILAWLGRGSLGAGDVKADCEGRDLVLDNVKVWAVAMVIWFHVVYYNLGWDHSIAYHDTETWLKGFEGFGARLLGYQSVVMMPAICFVSGHLSKGPPSRQRIRRYVQGLLIPTVLWLCLGKSLILPLMMEPSVSLLRTKLFALVRLDLFTTEWYLQALCLWRASAYLVWCHLHPSAALLAMLFVSCMAGYAEPDGFLGWCLQLGPTLGFLPYFAAGYTLPVDRLLQIGSSWRSPLTRSLALMFVIVWIVWLMPFLSQGPLPDGHGTYSCCGGPGQIFSASTGADHMLFWTRRVAKFGLEMVPTLLLIIIVTPEGEMCGLSWMGPYTIFPFVLHYVANHWRDRLVQMLPLPVITSTSGHALVLMFYSVYAVGVMALLSTTIVRQCFDWCFNPTWTGAFFLVDPPLPNAHRADWSRQTSKQIESADPATPVKDLQQVQQREKQPQQAEKLPPPGSSDDDACSDNAASGLSTSAESNGGADDCMYLKRCPQTFVTCAATIPGMQGARFFYPVLCLLYFGIVAGIVGTAYGILYVIGFTPAEVLEFICTRLTYPLWITVLIAAGSTIGVYTWHIKQLSAALEPPNPSCFAGQALRHVVVVPNYKEPLPVLRRTISTIAAQKHLKMPPTLVLACEDRDSDAVTSFRQLSDEFGDALPDFLITKHPLQVGEVPGKSSNENWAVRKVYEKLVERDGLDPFTIMITICDADSLLSPAYLAKLEAAFWRQRDGRRLLYSARLNTYRNIGDASPLIQMYEMLRSHYDAFHSPWTLHQPQSNYSILLGFAAEIDFWTPDNIPEDLHTCRKAQINNFCSMTTVRIEPYIVNDMVTDFGDRYVQAKRHSWGVTEFAWVCSLYSHMSFQAWLLLMATEISAGRFVEDASLTASSILQIWILASIWVERHSRQYGAGIYAILFSFVFSWLMFWIGELVIWRKVLSGFQMRQPSRLSWMVLLICAPVLKPMTDLFFQIVPTLHCLFHMNVVGDLLYVNAPKS